jgi:CheY-like chemotaxis protein/predicted negative regulator of RcsB-dependent stress response
MSDDEHRSTILMVGQGEPMQTALGEALRRHGISVAGCATPELEQAIRVYAPDLVVLIGDAAVRGGTSVLRRMAANRATDVLPVAVISNDAALKDESGNFRTGAVAVVPRGAGADAIARRLAELAEEVPQRSGLLTGEINESNLQDVVDLVSNETRTGILSIRSPKGVLEGMPVVIETERPSAHNAERILERLREAMNESKSLRYEFHETNGGRLSTLPAAMGSEEVDLSHLSGARVVLLDSDELRAEKLAQLLTSRGVRVAAADFSTAVIPRVREIDPQVVVLDSTAVGGRGIELVRAIRRDPQLRWASMLVVRWEDYWPSAAAQPEPDLAQLAGRIFPLIEQDLDIARRVEEEVDFDTRLELVGPGRLLRALGSVAGVRHVAVAGPKRSIEVDIADNSILGAYATLHEGATQSLQGMPALLALWGLNSGRVSVREQDLPSVANIMMPVDEALGVVSHRLGLVDGHDGIEVDAQTVPPSAPGVDEHATMPPGAQAAAQLEQARTMAPPRFGHLRGAQHEGSVEAFADEEAPTGKVARLLGRVETRQHPVPTAGGVQEHHGHVAHTDHAVARAVKSTQMGLAPVFEVLPEEEHKTVPVLQKPTPPPPPATHKPGPPPMFGGDDDDFEPELARVLEGPATVLSPAQGAGAMPAWIQALLLITLLTGVGVFGWQLWVRSSSDTEGSVQTLAHAEVEGKKGPITGAVNGLESTNAKSQGEQVPPKPEAEEGQSAESEPANPESAEVEPATAEQEIAKPEGEPDSEAVEAPKPESQPSAPKKAVRSIPTQNLPRDPAKASDILVYRAQRLIRSGNLGLAQATLDRAWELDPKNPQAMAGYAALYVATKDGNSALKWAKKAVRKRSRRPQYHIWYGDALKLTGDLDGARKAWRRALALDPDNRKAKQRLADTRAHAAK